MLTGPIKIIANPPFFCYDGRRKADFFGGVAGEKVFCLFDPLCKRAVDVVHSCIC